MKAKQPRNWLVVHIRFKKNGDMGDRRKEVSKNKCRTFKHDKEKDNAD